MIRALAPLVSTIALLAAGPAFAQDHSMHDMPGMAQPEQSKPARKANKPRQQRPAQRAQPRPAPKPVATQPQSRAPTRAPPADDMSGMDHSQHQQPSSDAMPNMPGMDHSQHDMGAASGMQMTGTALPAGNTPPPPIPTDHYADRDFPADEMARARSVMMKDQGAKPFGQVLLNIFEYQAHKGRDGYRWDGEGWYGGDLDRVWIKSEGEGEFGRGIDTAEVQALYSRAVDPYFNLQAGIRQDFGRGPDRTYSTVGFEGLAPGFFEVEGALFLSNKGDLIGRVEGYYDQRLTQRLIFQPRAEFNFSAQDVPENDIGSGLVNVELGARLRYEISRQFAPYVGLSYLRKTGDTARLSRLAGEDVHATSFVAGIRFWF